MSKKQTKPIEDNRDGSMIDKPPPKPRLSPKPRKPRGRKKAKADGSTPTIFDTFTIRIDTREQSPFTFHNVPQDKSEGGGQWAKVATVRDTLKTGDYSIDGFHRSGLTGIAVERKSKEDLYSTISQGRERFERELERLNRFRFALIVVESELSDTLANPPTFTELPAKIVSRSVISFQVRFPGIHWAFLPGREIAMQYVFRYLMRARKSIIEDVYKVYPQLEFNSANGAGLSDSEIAMILKGL